MGCSVDHRNEKMEVAIRMKVVANYYLMYCCMTDILDLLSYSMFDLAISYDALTALVGVEISALYSKVVQ